MKNLIVLLLLAMVVVNLEGRFVKYKSDCNNTSWCTDYRVDLCSLCDEGCARR